MSRRSESLAPSLFPFLAVLLCTMGALVVMLLLLVVGAQSSAQEVADKVEDEFEWEHEKIQLVKSSLAKRYEEAQLEIESKRLHLQNIEQHIQQLTEELEELAKTALAVEKSRKEEIESQKKERDQLREALEKQLTDAKKKIESKVKDPKGDKPIFAIIPYEGGNGTHRRPIYLECNAKGLVVQPEGVVLAPSDLAPPYGPGNPLDSVLRTIRAEYPSTSGSLTSNPYPLLVVRPSGIKHYMMARAAMSGWDDQFGYELISEDLELTFPAGVPNLEKKIVSAVEVARERQAALVMAMPQHYNASQLESYGSGGNWDESSEDVSGIFDNVPAGEESGSSGSIGSSSRSGRGRGGMSMLGTPGGAGGAPNSDAMANRQGGPGGQGAEGQGRAGGQGGPGSSPNLAQSLAQSGNGKANGDGWTFEQSINSAQSAAGGPPNIAGTTDKLAAGGGRGGSGSGGSMSFFGSGSSDELGFSSGSSRNQSSGGSGYGGTGYPGSGDVGDDTGGGDSAGGSGGSGGSSSGGSASGSGSGGSATQSAGTQNGGSSNKQNMWNSASGGTASGGSSSGGGGGSPMSGGQFSMEPMTDPGSVGSTRASNAGDPSQMSGEVQNVGMNVDMSKKRGEPTKSVAQSKGRGWAWRDGNNSKTAVVRAIWLQCYNDQWIIRPDKGSNAAPTVIKLEGSAMQRAEQLAQAVRDRVESWGMALSGGHWTPVIHVEVATDAENRFQQLQKLMEGSGIEVIRKNSIPPKQTR